jgi:hypothetical protein
MKKIELIENYFGSNVVIDNESLYTHKGDQRDPKIVDDLKGMKGYEIIKNIIKSFQNI